MCRYRGEIGLLTILFVGSNLIEELFAELKVLLNVTIATTKIT